jgi:tetratricopeptide (TPR) repeat protein
MKVYLLGQLHDNVGAAKVIETMLASNQVPADQVAAKETIVAQVAFQQKDYAKTIQFTDKLLKTDPNDADLLDLNARSYYLKGDYKTAIDGFNKLIKVKPTKPTYEFLMSSYYKLDNKTGVVSTLEKMIELYPSPEYWKDIFKYVKGEASYTEREQIEIYRLQRAVGAIEAGDLSQMAELSLAMTDPGDAKSALEFGLSSNLLKEDERTKKLLNLARTQASQDLAGIDATAKEAAGKPDGSALAKIGAAYLGHGQYDKAISTLQSAISKGGLKSPDEVTVQLGAAQYNAGKKSEAIKTFQSVSDKSKLHRLASLWVIFIKQH